MELHALDREGAVTQAHDHAVVGPRRDGQLGGHRRPLDDEAVVAGGLERGGQAGEHARAVVVHQRGLAVHDLGARTTSPPYTWPMHW